MEEQDVRERAEALGAALVEGDVGRATEDFSKELRQNLGEVIALLPLPASEATVESVDRAGAAGYTAILRLVGETDEVQIQTRWKERDGRATVIEVSHLSRIETAAEAGEQEGDEGGSGGEAT